MRDKLDEQVIEIKLDQWLQFSSPQQTTGDWSHYVTVSTNISIALQFFTG